MSPSVSSDYVSVMSLIGLCGRISNFDMHRVQCQHGGA